MQEHFMEHGTIEQWNNYSGDILTTMALIGLLIIGLLVVIFIFASPKLSPIPYFPTNHKDLPLILTALKLQNNQTIADLGAGDGIVVFSAASKALQRKLNTQFVAVDINPILVLIMNIRRFFHPNRKNIKILWSDMFLIDYNKLISTNLPAGVSTKAGFNRFKPISTFYLYISPWLLDKVLERIKKVKTDKSVISYYYPIKQLKNSEKVIKGVHSVFTYTFE